jgi:hypothetical protein
MSCNKKIRGGNGAGFGLGLGVGVLGAAVVGNALANSRRRADYNPCPDGQGVDRTGRCRDFAGGKILNFKEFSDAYLAGGHGRSMNDAVLFEAFALQLRQG